MRGRALSKETIKILANLRQRGLSIKDICEYTKLPKTTVALHIKYVKILPEYINAWKEKRRTSILRKLHSDAEALVFAQRAVTNLSKKEKLLFISALYWAEGNKKDFILSNTDPVLIKIFIEGLRQLFGIKNDILRISIRIYEDLDKEACLRFWSEVTKVPKEQFLTTNIIKGKKQGKLLYGMCRVRVCKGGNLLKNIKSINTLVANYMSL